MKEESENVSIKVVAILIAVLTVIAILFCFLVYYNQVKSVKLNLDDFSLTESAEKCAINNITNENGNIILEGEYFDNIKDFQIYIQLVDSDGNTKNYRTQMKNDNKFKTIIKEKNISENTKINIIYMCNGEKMIINTNKTVK